MIDSRAYPHSADALKYASDITSGKILACKYIRQACERHLADLEDTKSPYYFDLDAAERICNFIEMLPHTKGRWARRKELLKLEPWQKFFLTSMFGWMRKNGTRRFREAYIEVPRKNAKSTLLAGVGLYMLVVDEEYGAEVYSGATSEKQAWEVFRPAKKMAEKTEDFTEYFGVEVNASNICVPEDGSRFEPIIGNPGDGASPSCALVDEYHEHRNSDLFDTMQTGMGARTQPIMFAITTAGTNLAGPCYDKRNQLIKILEGVIKNDEVFGLIYTIDEDDDWASPKVLRKANPNFDVSISPDFLIARQREATTTTSKQNVFKTKHLNVWVGAMNAWMNMQTWDKCPKRKSLEELAGRQCFVGLDLASKIDVAAAMYLFPPTEDDPLWHVHGKYYMPEDVVLEHIDTHSQYDTWSKQGFVTLTDGNVIDYDPIMDDLRDAAIQFQLESIGVDPWQSSHLTNILTGEGLPMAEVRQTVQNFSEPMKELEALVISLKLAHGGCPVLTWMISNVVAKLDKKDNIFPNKEKPENKIDGVVGLIMAIARALSGDENGVSVYEERGMLVI